MPFSSMSRNNSLQNDYMNLTSSLKCKLHNSSFSQFFVDNAPRSQLSYQGPHSNVSVSELRTISNLKEINLQMGG